MRIEETIAIAALCQAIVKKLYTLYTKNLSFRRYSRALILENKWRAVRYGLDGKLIDFGKQKEVPTRDLIRELLEFVDDVVDELGSRKELEFIHEILEMGSGADRQIKVYEDTKSFDEVVAYIHKQSTMGLHDDVGPYIKDIR
jgi:carboxylate-amine ligase